MAKKDIKEGAQKDATEAPGGADGERRTASVADAAPQATAESPETPQAEDQQARALSAELAELRALHEAALRQAADAENAMREMQERIGREQERIRQYAAEAVAVGLLPVLDDLERALDGWRRMGLDSGLVDGLELIHRNWLETFGRFDIERLTPERGAPFDPHRHEAMSTAAQEGAAPNTVWEVVQPGYLLHDRVLRPARVVVTQPAAAASEDEASQPRAASAADAAGRAEPEASG